MRHRMVWAFVVAAVAGVVTAGCGSDSPMAPSGAGVVVEGVVLGEGASFSATAAVPSAAAQARKVTVRVEGTTLTVDVGANGTFKIDGVPSGTFTLVFLSDGVEVGRVVVSAGEGTAVKIVVQVKGSELVVVELKVEAPGAGAPASASCSVNGGKLNQGIELEGDVASGSASSFRLSASGRASFPIEVNAGGASFTCVGNAKTTSAAECKASVQTGAKVHVKGTLASCNASSALVTASEVKVQKG